MEGASVLNESLDDTHSFLDMELEALQSIYINEIEVEIDSKSTTISIDLHPATADKLDEQYVRMTLQFLLDEGYPEDIPKVKIRNPRGLSEEKLNCVMKDLLAIAEDKRGNSMLFEMIESAKEHLTIGNRPSGECAICLHGFSDKDVFTKTECYHYFHSHCLARYSKNFLENSEDYETDSKSKTISNELLCPMCRIPIQFKGHEKDYPPPEASDDGHFALTDEVLDLQKKMADLYQKQVEKGGIIDIEAEKNKFLIEISNVPTRINNEEKLDEKPQVENDAAIQKTDTSDQIDSPSREKKYDRDQNQRTDYRGRNRNFNKQNDNRGNYRSGGRYNNRQSYGDFRGNHNRNKYDRYPVQRFDRNRGNSRRNNEDSKFSESARNSDLQSSDAAQAQDFAGSSAQCDDASEIAEQQMCDSKNKPNSSSPRYNRGYRRGNNYSYNSRYGDRRSDKTSFQDSQNSHVSQKQSSFDDDGDTCKSEDKELKERSSEYGEYRKPHYRSDRYRQDNYVPKERYSESRNSHRGGVVDNEDEDICKSEDKEPKERTSEYDEYRKPHYRSDRYRQDNYISKERYSDRNAQRGGTVDNEGEEDRERGSEYGVRKPHYRSDRYRQDNDYESRERYSDRNSQRGGRGGYMRRGNYSHDSHYSGKNRYVDADKDQYYADRDRNYRGRRIPRDDRYRGNNTHDGYRQKSSRNYAGNNYVKHADEHYHQTSASENHEPAELSSRSQSSDSNHHSVDSGTLDNSSSSKYSKSLLDKPEAQVEKDISDFDKKSSVKLTDKSAEDGYIPPPTAVNEKPLGSLRTALNPPPGFANPLKKVIYGLQGANPPPGFNRS